MYGARKQPQLSVEELLHLRWLLGGALALTSIWTLFYLEAAIWPAAILATAAVLVAMIFPALPGHVPRFVWKLGVPAIVVVLALDLYLHDMIPAFVRLNVLLVLFRVMQYRTRSEDLQLAMLCLFLVVITGVLTVSISFAVQILLFTGIGMAFLFIVNLIHDATGGEPVPPATWVPISRKRFLVRLWHVFDLRMVALAAMLFVAVIVISTVIFLAIPRFQMDSPAAIFALHRSGSLTGFSESVSFGDTTDITKDDSIAMRIDVHGGNGIPAEPYWRMVVLDEYADGNFRTSRAIMAHVGVRSFPTVDFVPKWAIGMPPPAGSGDGNDLRYVVFLEGGISRYLPLPGSFTGIRFKEVQDIVENDLFRAYSTEKQNAVLLSYQILGADFSGVIPDPGLFERRYPSPRLDFSKEDVAPRQIRARSIDYPATTLSVPVSEREADYMRSVVETITAGRKHDNATTARLICAYLASSHTYSLGVTIPASDQFKDPVVRWIADGLPGHCELFAGAFALLARTAGVPARLVSGFRSGTWNGYENYYMVRNSDAHTWCEIYDGQGAWLRVDPTPGGSVVTRGQIPPVEELATDSTFSAYLDSLRMIWYRRIVSFDEKSQRSVAGSIRSVGDSVKLWTDAVAITFRNEFNAWANAPWSFTNKGDILCLTTMLFCVAVLMKQFGIGNSDVLEWFRRGEKPTRRRAGELLMRLQTRLENPRRHGRRWNVDQAHEVAAALALIRFGRMERWPKPMRVFRDARRLI